MAENMLSQIIEYLDGQQKNMEQTLTDLVSIESPSANKEGVDKVCNYICDFCDQLGMKIDVKHYDKAGNSFRAVLNEDVKADEIVIMGHMDTVHDIGSFGEHIVSIDEEGFIHGPGVYDMKGGLVIALYTCKALKESGYRKRPIKLIFSGDEETGHKYSTGEEVFTEDADHMVAALNCESGMLDGRVAVGRRGSIHVIMKIYGKPAHSGNAPWLGRSAIREAAHKIIEIDGMTDYENTTYSCAIVKGGKVMNQIPDYCEVGIDVRVKTVAAIQEALEKLLNIAGHNYIDGTITTIEVDGKIANPMEATDANKELFEKYKKASQKVGAIEPKAFFSGGGSDCIFTSGAGVPSLCTLGIRGSDNHSLDERALLSSLSERAKILAALIIDL